jgi:ribosome recycling factor
MDKKILLEQVHSRMDFSIKAFDNNLNGLRVGRASSTFLDPVQVEVYGSRTLIAQVSTISTPDARTITVQVWDKGNVKAVEKSISEANLGLNPSVDGQIIRISIPPLSEDRRKELVKVGEKYCEESKVSIRNIRRDFIDDLRKAEKAKLISEDEMHSLTDKIQKVTDKFIDSIDKKFVAKELEILSI